jgi:ADP-ribosylglycohydrolase
MRQGPERAGDGAGHDVACAARARGCLLGGALGDAIGAPAEFLSLSEIRASFGPAGLTGPAPAYGRVGAITDDTQMTLFTAEGLLGARRRATSYGISAPEASVLCSYLRWLATQGETASTSPRPGGSPVARRGLLWEHPAMHHRRAPGATCLGALRSGRLGSPARPLNDSKGCGGVMRAAPAAWFGGFRTGVAVAALTHGHPTGYLTAGALAEILRVVAQGGSMQAGVDAALAALAGWEAGPMEAAETVAAIGAAHAAARSAAGGEPPSAELVERFGQGWVAEEALAIGLYAALVAGDFREGVLLAVNHSGDSDSTGAIAGQLLGALGGEATLPADWLARLEARELVAEVATDLCRPIPDAERDQAAYLEHGRRYPYYE